MKFYTIIDIWGTDEVQDCWIAQFKEKSDAKSCFFDHIHHHAPEIDDETIEFGFNDCLTGAGFPYECRDEYGTLFVRNEEVQDKFDPKEMPWA